jgi:hypothetical protein
MPGSGRVTEDLVLDVKTSLAVMQKQPFVRLVRFLAHRAARSDVVLSLAKTSSEGVAA